MLNECEYSALDIANWFLNYNEYLRNCEDEDTDEISNLKLQKLLYYAEGCFLAIAGKSLFSDKIYAWKHGPVVEGVYYKYKQYGSKGISEYDDLVIENKEDVALLKEIYDVFGKYSAWGLREMTHKETPWLETDLSAEIDRELIKEYFIENYAL